MTKTVAVIGTARSEHVARARERAIANSLIAAVERVTAEILPFESMVQNFATLNDLIFIDTRNFIQHYKVLTEARSDKVYRVMVQATVSIDSISERLSSAGILLGNKPMPKILFIVVEQNINEAAPQFWNGSTMTTVKTISEETMGKALKASGLLVIDRSNFRQELKDITLSCSADFENQEAILLGTRLKADIVIVGKAVVSLDTETSDEESKTFEGIVNARALRTDSGVEIAAAEETVILSAVNPISGGRQALSDAGSQIGQAFAEQIISEWKKDIKKLMAVKIFVKGTGNLANFVIFRKALNELPGVKWLQTSEMKPDQVILLTEYEGQTQDLAAAVASKNFETITINIAEISPTDLKIELIPKE
ncbi:MAG: hypothetical protein V3S66_05430 [Desulfobacterales bacterium]